MRHLLPTLLATTAVLAALGLSAPRTDAAAVPPIVDRFLQRDDVALGDFVGVRHLEASVRNGWKAASMDVCTTGNGNQLTYRIIRESGSGIIRKRVLLAALEGEGRMRRDHDIARAALNPDNYAFSTSAHDASSETRVDVHALRRDVSLVDGAIFLDPDGDLLRVEGLLSKSPSFWTRRVAIVRRYERIQGVRVPVSMESNADVRIFGRSTFRMTYDYAAINGVSVTTRSDAQEPPDCQ